MSHMLREISRSSTSKYIYYRRLASQYTRCAYEICVEQKFRGLTYDHKLLIYDYCVRAIL